MVLLTSLFVLIASSSISVETRPRNCICPDNDLTRYAYHEDLPCGMMDFLFEEVAIRHPDYSRNTVCDLSGKKMKGCCGAPMDKRAMVPKLDKGEGLIVVSMYDNNKCEGTEVYSHFEEDTILKINECTKQEMTRSSIDLTKVMKSYKIVVNADCTDYDQYIYSNPYCAGEHITTNKLSKHACQTSDKLTFDLSDMGIEDEDLQLWMHADLVANVPECGNHEGNADIDTVVQTQILSNIKPATAPSDSAKDGSEFLLSNLSFLIYVFVQMTYLF